MGFQEIDNQIIWRVHFASSIEKVFDALTTNEGRKNFWAEEAPEKDGYIEFNILNYPKYKAKILKVDYPTSFELEYFGTDVNFSLSKTADKGTDLLLTAVIPNDSVKYEMTAGWVSVLLAMKAAIDFDVDLRNHHPKRVWDEGFVDN